MTTEATPEIESEEARVLIESFHTAISKIRTEVQKVIVGQDEVAARGLHETKPSLEHLVLAGIGSRLEPDQEDVLTLLADLGDDLGGGPQFQLEPVRVECCP